jgi:hypothetical protein
MPLNIVQWNLLAPELSGPDWFVNSQREHLDPERRFRLIRTRIAGILERNRKTVFCFQELCVDWIPQLRILFTKYGQVNRGLTLGRYGGVSSVISQQARPLVRF